MFKEKLELRPSYLLTLFFVLIHGGAIVGLLCLSLPWWFAGVLVGLCGYSLIMTTRRYALLSSTNAIVKLWPLEGEHWQLETRYGQILSTKLRGDSICSAQVVMLNFDSLGKRRSITVLLLRDSLEENSFRRLRAGLRT